jgi:hypothetical protein
MIDQWLRALVALILSAMTATQPAVRTSLPPPEPTTTVPAGLHCPDFYGAALDAGWATTEAPQLDRIMWRESHCTPTATHRNANGSIDRGLMQVNSIHLTWLAQYGIGPDDLLVASVNLTAARRLYEQDGWAPWRPLP